MNTLWMAAVALWVLAEKTLALGQLHSPSHWRRSRCLEERLIGDRCVLSKKSICAAKHSTEPPAGRAWRMYKSLDAVYRGRNAR
jgi:hypothetical protein